MPWYSVQLSSLGEKETAKSVVRTVKSVLGKDIEVFVPCVRGEGQGYRKEFYLVDGYFFVFFPEQDMKALLSLENEPFFETVVAVMGKDRRRRPVVIEEREIANIRRRIAKELKNPDGVAEGDHVEAIDGDCRYLKGVVKSITGGNALVLFDFHSKKKRVKIPLFCLKKDGEDV